MVWLVRRGLRIDHWCSVVEGGWGCGRCVVGGESVGVTSIARSVEIKGIGREGQGRGTAGGRDDARLDSRYRGRGAVEVCRGPTDSFACRDSNSKGLNEWVFGVSGSREL